MKTTDELAHEIQEAGDILRYFETNQGEMQLRLSRISGAVAEKEAALPGRCGTPLQPQQGLCLSNFFRKKVSLPGQGHRSGFWPGTRRPGSSDPAQTGGIPGALPLGPQEMRCCSSPLPKE